MPPKTIGWLPLTGSLLVALTLRVMDWPQTLASLNPDWVMLVLVYWSLAAPERVGVGSAWLTGLFTDVMTGRLLGQHAFVYALIAYICARFHLRLRLFPMLQQMAFILLCLLVSQFMMFWLETLRGKSVLNWFYWLPSLTGALTWPLVQALLSRFNRRQSIFE